MIVKKAGGKIYGAQLTAAERKAMNIEINKQIAENERKHMMEVDALVLWELHVQLGFGPTRLKRFYMGFASALNSLLRRYEMGVDDAPWLTQRKLQEMGIDLEEWYKEALQKEEQEQ